MRAVRREASCSTSISSVSPTHGEQENSVWDGHYECTCYPLFVFNQFGDLERRMGWRAEAGRGAVGGKFARIYFWADAGFVNPEVYDYLEAERIKYAIRLQSELAIPSSASKFIFIAFNQCDNQHGTGSCSTDEAAQAAGDAFLQQPISFASRSRDGRQPFPRFGMMHAEKICSQRVFRGLVESSVARWL